MNQTQTQSLSWQQSIARQREALADMISLPLERIADRCAAVWPERELLDQTLSSGLHELPYCQFLYVLDREGVQISDNASHQGLLPEHFGRDRSQRPYMRGLLPIHGMHLSEAYLSLRAHRPSVTAVQVIRHDDRIVGFLGADFDLRDLPLTRELYDEPSHWRQIKGDPAIRSGVFLQRRAESEMDRRIDDVLPIIEELIVQHGVFHGKLHFSSNRATIWHVNDPYRYRLLDIDMLVDPSICFAYPTAVYPANAVIRPEQIRPILEGFRELRFADETIYLRAGSVNIFNGLVALNFSCDGSHYLPHAEFLDRDNPFWTSLTPAGA
ncbi:PDC sensor domain-containing protein [Thiohalobacter sp. IOR34]|uniref:PDC sensor domain-containing protein n=1 Tax=Thiohalobacter sp. IOR34 TaxID=3057176 RepID=UPI0025B095CA|nr:PDC sensor domain-containing protein [Thiohalobacter sp. IOR34]WJW75256.1 PDC sensor domain-containing protein [Thiohalobacter sp. IOR34]